VSTVTGGLTTAAPSSTAVGRHRARHDHHQPGELRAAIAASLRDPEPQISGENQTAARGRIMDADFAMETANLSRAQVLQQAGTAMIAQANALPNEVLALLR
jgi:flagellin